MILKKKREEIALKKIRDEINSWRCDNPAFMIVGALNEIKKDKNLLEYYFPEVNWSNVDKDAIYSKLFEDSASLNQEPEQVGRRNKH